VVLVPCSEGFVARDPVRLQSVAMSGSSAAGEDIVQHLSSNSNPSSSKLAKLEARMAGKAVSAPSSPPHHPMSAPVISFMDQEELPETSSSDDDVSLKP
jgi:tousled-like kinase